MVKRWSMALFSLLALAAVGGEVADRRMVWAHYVPWYKPENTSLTTEYLYNYPLHDIREPGTRAGYYREEIERAKSMGIDGFFIDCGFKPDAPTNDWDLRPWLEAARGMEFEIGVCMDGDAEVPHKIKEFTRMFQTYGKHPNYPRFNGKYVIATYPFWRWKYSRPEDWREMLNGIRNNGLEMFVIANVDPRGNNSVDLKKLQAYADVIDCGYMFGPPGGTNEPPEINNPILNKFFSERNKLFMPCLHGGYYGAWLKSGNDFYQPFYGVDMLHNTFLAAQKLDSPWIHLTSYNDLIETAMMPRAFTFGMEQLIRAYSNAHKKTGTLFAEPEIIFSYHREEQPGTLFRIEAMNLPSVGNAAVIVRGRLLDMDGKPVFELPPKRFAPDAFGRAEWLVSTTNLVRSPYLVPEFSAEAGDWKHIVRAPAVFFVSSWLQNAVTMTVPLSGLTDISNSLKINYSADRLHAEIKFDSPCELKRAVLFKNDRPVALFSPDLKAEETMLVCKLTNINQKMELSVEGGRILRAVKNYERNGCPWFRWDALSLTTTNTPGWSVLALTCAGGDDLKLKMKNATGEIFEISAHDLAVAGETKNSAGRLLIQPEMTLQNAAPLKLRNGTLNLTLWAHKSRPADSFYVRYETMDGKVAFSDIQYPFASGNPVKISKFIETPVNLETWSGPTGWCYRNKSEFLTPKAQIPLKKTRLVTKPLSLLTERSVQYKFDGSGDDALGFYALNIPEKLLIQGGHDGKGGAVKFTGTETLPMRFRVWPGSTARISFYLNPTLEPQVAQSVIFNKGWTDGLNINLLPDKRIEVIRSFHAKTTDAPTENWNYEKLQGKTPLVPGQWTKIEIVSDAETMRLYINEKFDGKQNLKPVRSIGNCTAILGGGLKGYQNYTGLLDELLISGLSEK